MNKLIILLFLFATVASFSQIDKYGKEISLKEKTTISKILDKPEDYVGKTVLVEGEIYSSQRNQRVVHYTSQ